MPCVQRLLRTVTGIEPKSSINPDEAVSLGAAVLAGIMDGDIKNMEVMSAWQAAMYKAFYEQQLEQEKGNKTKLGTEKVVKASKIEVQDAEDGIRVMEPKVIPEESLSKKSSLLRTLLRKRKNVPR